MPKIFLKTLATLAISMALFSPVTFATTPPPHAEAIMDYLKSEGYKVSIDKKHIIATTTHKERFSIYLIKYFKGILVTTYMKTNSKGKKELGMLRFILNTLNARSISARLYLSKHKNIMIESYYPGKYNKESFATFLKTFNLTKINILDRKRLIAPYVK